MTQPTEQDLEKARKVRKLVEGRTSLRLDLKAQQYLDEEIALALAVEREKGMAWRNEAEELLADLREFIDGQIDVVDGDYGVPHPNRAMQLAQRIDDLLPPPPARSEP